jgi:hypothetical protein
MRSYSGEIKFLITNYRQTLVLMKVMDYGFSRAENCGIETSFPNFHTKDRELFIRVVWQERQYHLIRRE